MKKGQAEMVGLAVIVILLVISFLFYVSFKEGDYKDAMLVRSSVRANNILNAVLSVTVNDKQMKDLLNECKTENNCDYVRSELENIFNIILLEKQNYKFSAFKEETEIFDDPIEEGTCDKEVITANPARFPDGYKYEFQLCYS